MCFAQTFDAIEPALARFRELRALPAAPSVLALRRERHGELSVWGVFEGARAQVDTVCNALRLTKIEETPSLHLTRDKEEELVDGVVPPSALPKLLAAMPVGTPWQVFGTGQVHVVGTPAASDACLSTLAMLAGCGEIRLGAPARRGKSTPLDPGAAQLERDLRHALDPESRLQ